MARLLARFGAHPPRKQVPLHLGRSRPERGEGLDEILGRLLGLVERLWLVIGLQAGEAVERQEVPPPGVARSARAYRENGGKLRVGIASPFPAMPHSDPTWQRRSRSSS